MVKTGVKVDPGKKFTQSIQKALKKVDDLRPPFKAMSKEYYKTNKALFTLKSKGLYADLSTNYKPIKKKKFGFLYPILKATGKLEKSLTIKSQDSIELITKKTMILGTKTKNEKGAPYPVFLQNGWKTKSGSTVPARPFLLIGTEPHPQAKQKLYERRLELWLETIESYVLKVTKES